VKQTLLFVLVAAALSGCAAMHTGWYKPGNSPAGFAQDKYECMSNSQMAVSGAYVNKYGGVANSYTTTNTPLFSACMQAHGYTWTNQAAVNNYEASQQETEIAAARERASAASRQNYQAAQAAVAGVTPERLAAARNRCRAKAADQSLCDQLTAEDVLRSEAVAARVQ
jgi:hypothetical protein